MWSAHCCNTLSCAALLLNCGSAVAALASWKHMSVTLLPAQQLLNCAAMCVCVCDVSAGSAVAAANKISCNTFVTLLPAQLSY
jgi:hypothetical protein